MGIFILYVDFLVGAFLKKRVDNSHGFSSVFFKTTWSDQNSSTKSLQNFEKTPNCTCWPKELNQKGFPRIIQYRTRPKGLPFRFFRHCATSQFFSTKGSPLHFFGVLQQNGCWKIPKGPSFQFFSALWDFLKKIIKGSPIHQYFDILKSFCYFWALDMAPTWTVPGLFSLKVRGIHVYIGLFYLHYISGDDVLGLMFEVVLRLRCCEVIIIQKIIWFQQFLVGAPRSETRLL